MLATGASQPAATAEAPLRVLPLGDSITDGGADGGYRSDLWHFFQADGRSVDFVGSRSGGPAHLGDKDHEGWPSMTIQWINDNVVDRIPSLAPDVILLHIGTNDLGDDTSIAGAPERLRNLIDRITTKAPSAKLYVASIIPIADNTKNRRVLAYNATIPGIVGSFASAGKNVSFVDMNSAVPAVELADGVHPTYGGYSKMAARWYSAILGTPMLRYEAEATANAALSGDAIRRIDGDRSSGGQRVGYIDVPNSSTLTFTVYAGKTGPHRAYIRGGNGMTTPCSHFLSVNGGPASTVTYPNYGWEQWGVVGVTVNLNAGPNTLRFTKGDCYTEIDALDLTTSA
ncbi:GDSL-type esterase/lipase family protein [Fodinicola acaciae]|uniref:GDSL-type esterase/lipase family protein n=1 Tax=Fodinicola acaciae TaxID=2681555 RepID=UPI0013D62291|nr:GDSL-type esterase/lipase family protein [Fodinicola acaciae]